MVTGGLADSGPSSGNVAKGMLDTLAHLPVQYITVDELDTLVHNPGQLRAFFIASQMLTTVILQMPIDGR